MQEAALSLLQQQSRHPKAACAPHHPLQPLTLMCTVEDNVQSPRETLHRNEPAQPSKTKVRYCEIATENVLGAFPSYASGK